MTGFLAGFACDGGRLVSFLFLFPVLSLSLSLEALTLAFLSSRFVAVETVINILPAPCPSRGQLWRFPCRSIRAPLPSWASTLPHPDLRERQEHSILSFTRIPLSNSYYSGPSIGTTLTSSQSSSLFRLTSKYPLCPRPRGNCQTSLMLISKIPLGTLRCQFSAHPTVSPRPNRSILSTFHPRLYSSFALS